MIVAILQARCGSKRLPNKVLLKLKGKTIIEHIVDRLKQCKQIDKIIVTTSINKKDDKIQKICNNLGIDYFRGSENDVLERFYECAQKYKAKQIIRVCADSPCIDSKIVNKLINVHLKSKNDYSSLGFVDQETYPDGMNIEIFTFNVLKILYQKAFLKSDLEHVTSFLKNYYKQLNLKIYILKHKPSYNYIRLSLDYKKDFKLLKKIFNKLYEINNYFGLKEIIELFKNNPKLLNINKNIRNNEGYFKSLEKN